MVVIRLGLVASLLAVAFPLLTSIWPEAGDEARRLLVVVENAVRPVMERLADEFGVNRENRERSAIRFAEGEELVTAPVRTTTSPARETITIFRGSRVEVFPKSARDGSRVRVHRGRRRVSGWARAIDGDSLEVNGAEVRLHGIDAPEYGQSCRLQGRRWPCGREAKQALASRIRGKRVACEVRDRDSYGRLVATCSIAGRDLNAWMVEQGWAFAYRRYSRAYIDEEAGARAERRGVWMGEVVAPWKWRKGRRG